MGQQLHLKTAIITGSTSGVGKAITIGLARLSYRIILPVRSLTKANELKIEIQKKTGNENIEIIYCDFSSLQNVREAAMKINSIVEKIDLLSLNAATLPFSQRLTKEGFDEVFVVNYLSQFLFTNLLLEKIKNSSPSRIIVVAGSKYVIENAKIDLNDLQNLKSFNPLLATLRATAAKTMFVSTLSHKLEGSKVTINAFHPGLVSSDLSRQFPFYLRWIFRMASLFMSKDCKPGIYAATDPALTNVSGKLIEGKKISEIHFKKHTSEDLNQLFTISEKLCFQNP